MRPHPEMSKVPRRICAYGKCQAKTTADPKISMCIGCSKFYCRRHLKYSVVREDGKFNNLCDACYSSDKEKLVGLCMTRIDDGSHCYIATPDGRAYVYYDMSSNTYEFRKPIAPEYKVGVAVFKKENAINFLKSNNIPNWERYGLREIYPDTGVESGGRHLSYTGKK